MTNLYRQTESKLKILKNSKNITYNEIENRTTKWEDAVRELEDFIHRFESYRHKHRAKV